MAYDAQVDLHLAGSRSRAAVVGVLWSVFSSLTPGLVSAGVFLATSRALGPDDFGIVALASTIIALLGALAPTGFGQALIQRGSITAAQLDAVFWLGAGLAALLYALVCVLARPLAQAMGQPLLAVLMPVLGIKIVLDLISIVPNALLVRTMSFHKLALRTVVASLAGAVVCLAVLFAGYGLWALALAQLVSSAAATLACLVSAKWLPRVSFRRSALQELSRFGGFATGANFINSINIDQLLIGSLLGPYALGLFGFSRRIFQLLSDVMAGPLNAVSFSLLSSMQDEAELRRKAFLTATFLSALVSFPVFTGVALIAPDLVPFLFGAHWREAVPVVQAFCAIGLLACIGVLQGSLINSNGDADLWLYYLVGRQLATGICIVLLFRFGVAELSIGLAIQTYLMWLPSVHMVARILNMPMLCYLWDFRVPVLATLAMAVSIQFTSAAWPLTDPAARIIAAVAVGALVYGSVAWLLAHRQLHAIWDMISKRRSSK
jgi:O-antigen/teichoic acid export membrane protein